MRGTSRYPASDFVQDYAAKRQAQLERAKRIRDDRLQQQGGGAAGVPASNNKVDASTVSRGALAGTRAPPQSSQQGDSPSKEDDFANSGRRRVLHVIEDDFKRATQSGIITPDQARQLWAMLSNQIIRVDCSQNSCRGDDTGSGSLASVLASSSGSSGGPPMNFSGTISLESLRRSIALFKEQQRKLKGGDGSSGRQGRDSHNSEQSGRHDNVYNVAMQTFQQGSEQLPPPHVAQDEEDEDSEDHYHRIASRKSTNRTGGGGRTVKRDKPEWNTNTEVLPGDVPVGGRLNMEEGGEPRVSARVSGKAASKVDVKKRPAFNTQSGIREEERGTTPSATSASQWNSPAPPVAGRRSGGTTVAASKGTRQESSAAPTKAPHAPVLLDDVPVGGGGGMNSWDDAFPPGYNPQLAASNARGGGRNNHEIAEEALQAETEPHQPCRNCGRNFRVSILSRHERVCTTQANKKRRVFDVSGQRLDGIEGLREVRQNHRGNDSAASKKASAVAASGKMPKWKMQHQQFQAAMKAIHQPTGTSGGFGSGALPPPPKPLPAELDDRVPCPHCGRKFADDVAARHIPKCATTIAKPKGIRPIRR